MAARLPTVGGDNSSWGTVLNTYLSVAHNADGTLKNLLVNVKDYGAVGDGSADDRAAIQSAIDAAAAASGGTVFLPKGIYLVGANPATPTNNIACALRLGNRVQLIGEGMESTTIKLANSANVSVISNYVSTNGTEANAEDCAIRNLKIDGNKANQSSTSHGISFSSYPLLTQATNDIDFDTHQYFENVEIYGTHDNGFVMIGRSAAVLHNVLAFKCDGIGFYPTFDTLLSGCVAGRSGLQGFYIDSSQTRVVGCASFYSGQITGSLGYGYHIRNVTQGNVMFSSCVAQDNRASGFTIDTSNRVMLSSCNADSNSTDSAGTFTGFDLYDCDFCTIVGCVAIERRADNVNSYQSNALRLRHNADHNYIQITHSATNSGIIGTAIRSDSDALEGNNILINAQGINSSQIVPYSSSITPDPYSGTTHRITLTGALTINATTNHHVGSRLAFIFTQDAPGGRVVTFNGQYKTNWTPNTGASKINLIEFIYDGTNWIQIASTVGI